VAQFDSLSFFSRHGPRVCSVNLLELLLQSALGAVVLDSELTRHVICRHGPEDRRTYLFFFHLSEGTFSLGSLPGPLPRIFNAVLFQQFYGALGGATASCLLFFGYSRIVESLVLPDYLRVVLCNGSWVFIKSGSLGKLCLNCRLETFERAVFPEDIPELVTSHTVVRDVLGK